MFTTHYKPRVTKIFLHSAIALPALTLMGMEANLDWFHHAPKRRTNKLPMCTNKSGEGLKASR